MTILAPPLAPLSDDVVMLRAWRPQDRDSVVAALQDPEIPRWTSVPSPYRSADYDAWLEAQHEQLVAGVGLHFLVVDTDEHLLGATGVQLTEAAPDIGYWCVREHRGRGYTARAVRLLSGYVRALGFTRVDIYAHEENLASQHVAAAAGFTRVAETTTVDRLGGGAAYLRFTLS
jgi:RimJ/RimL family protein N-acetyltransferase